ncbi:MAG: NUDIX domain-containing protein [Verrucomicrobiota bacterium]
MRDNRLDLIKHCPQCAAMAISVIDKNALFCDRCGLRMHFGPSAAVGGILCDGQGRVLLIRRAKDPGQGKLGLPGGFVDGRESAEDALRRETREEVGLEIESMEFLMSFPNRYPFSGVIYDTLDLFFICRVTSFDAARALDEAAGLEVVAPADIDLDEVAFVSARAALAHFKRSMTK